MELRCTILAEFQTVSIPMLQLHTIQILLAAPPVKTRCADITSHGDKKSYCNTSKLEKLRNG
jgi:hypothetical protein